jgi:hypothetical protein
VIQNALICCILDTISKEKWALGLLDSFNDLCYIVS